MTRPFTFLNSENLQIVLAVLNQSHETRVVGGAVRNALLDLPVADIDLATAALPAQVIEIAKAQGWRALPTGIDHGTITLMLGKDSFEVTTLREDVATDGRHAEVRFGTDFNLDAQRRDFTINALSVNANGQIFDYTGGLADIAARRVRFIGDAEQRIREDYLRILRFFRFSSSYAQGPLDADALRAIVQTRHGLLQLSKERISSEVFKTLLTRRAADVFEILSHNGILQLLLDGIGNPVLLRRMVDLSGEALPRLAALALFTGSDVPRLRQALRLSNADTQALETASLAGIRLHGLQTPPEKGALRELMFEHGKAAAILAVQLGHANSSAALDHPAWRSATLFVQDTPQPTLPFSGADLLARGIRPGRNVGATLKRLQSLWIRAGFPKDPQALAQLLDSALTPD